MLQQTFHRRSLKPGMVPAVLFCCLCVGLIPAGCGQGAGTRAAPTAAVGAAAAGTRAAPTATVGPSAPEATCSGEGCGPTLEVRFEVSIPQTYDIEVSVPEGQTFRMHCEGYSRKVISNSHFPLEAEPPVYGIRSLTFLI